MVEIVDYRPEWAAEFQRVGGAIRGVLGAEALRIHHIGSTSVPGLAAKDILDIQLTLGSWNRFDEVRERLEGLRFISRSEFSWDHSPPGWEGPEEAWEKRFFGVPPGSRRINLHVRLLGRPNQRYALLFRDYLRAHPAAAAAYAELKRRLAHGYGQGADITAYVEIKDPVCDIIMVGAEAWAAATGWEPGPTDV